MNIREELYRLFCVPKCTSCNKALKTGENVLCAECMRKYQGEKVRDCSYCFSQIHLCSCTPKNFKAAKIHHLFKISRYFANIEDSPTKKLIFSLKKSNLNRVFDFMANELAGRIGQHYGEEVSDIIIVPIPRRRKNVIKYGYDHACELAKRISRKLNCKTVLALKSLTKRDQKGLTGEERRQNIKFTVRNHSDFRGKRILILDDIVTSGSSMLEAARLIFTMSPKEVDGACFAISYRDIDLNTTLPF